MGLIDSIFEVLKDSPNGSRKNSIGYGSQKNDGSHNHTYNKGSDRTPSQKEGDEARSGPRD